MKSNRLLDFLKIYTNNLLTIGVLLLIVSACSVGPDSEEVNSDDEINDNIGVEGLNIPSGFDFSTHQEVKVTIEANTKARYDVYAYSDERYFSGMETYQNEEGKTVTDSVFKSDVLNKLIFSGVPYNGKISQTISLPKYYNKVYILKNDNLKYSSSIEKIINQEVNYSEKSNTTGRVFGTVVDDFLYCVNGSGELFQIDPLTGVYTYISNMPMGSYTCAIDQANKVLYSIGKSSPFPLMKYSIENNTWVTVKNLGKGGPRLDYNYRDGLLYFSNVDIIYTIDPNNGNFLSTWKINGLHNTNGGDLAFADDGTLFLCTFSGLYRLQLNQSNEYQSTRISSDNLPFQPTSMTFDSNQELWLSNSASSSDLIIMDTQTGGWQYNFGISANNNSDYGRTINDLTTFRIYSETIENPDSDGDGILDRDDAFPEDANKAFEVFTPSKYGWGTIAFEDLWPSTGDYDFNDVALNYKAIAVLNSQNLAVQLDLICNVKANGASYSNGFGLEIESLLPSQIQSVSGSVIKHSYINLNANGTEANQEKAVIIVFDDAHYVLNEELTISIKFTQPISTNDLGSAPFNPFMIINKIREKEVHLPKMHTTSLGNNNFVIDGVNKDPDGDYLTSDGLPWAISIIHDFKVPKEKVRVNNAYNYFNNWANSGGIQFQDWYKDNPGYRNDNQISN